MTTTDELYAAGKSVCAIANTEALYRASINRLYYATYHRCYDYHVALPQPGSVGNTNGRHNQLINQLNSPSPGLAKDKRAESVALGKLLRLICAQRVDSDYYMDRDISQDSMSIAEQTAESIFVCT